MTDYKPGTVAKAAVRGVPNVTVFAFAADTWASGEKVDGTRVHDARLVTDVRPLVVLDLGALSADAPHLAIWADAVDLLRRYESQLQSALLGDIADQIEAQTKPPRIPEPGVWGVVEAKTGPRGERTLLVRSAKASGADWTDVNDSQNWAWGDLYDPVLVREGV